MLKLFGKIYIANELIAIFIILSLYVDAIHIRKSKNGHVGIRKDDTISKLKLNNEFNMKEFIDDMHVKKKFMISALIAGLRTGAVAFQTSAAVVILLGAVSTPVGAIALTTASALLTSIHIYVQVQHHLKPLRTDLLGLYKSLYNTIFLKENTIPISEVRNKIKYWGLNKSQVDLLFN